MLYLHCLHCLLVRLAILDISLSLPLTFTVNSYSCMYFLIVLFVLCMQANTVFDLELWSAINAIHSPQLACILSAGYFCTHVRPISCEDQ